MKVIIYTYNIVDNIKKAETLVNRPISLMFKDFYEDIYGHIRDRVNNGTFSLHFDDSICYSISKSHMHQKGGVAVTEYGHPFSAALDRDNFFGTQFHPEKSGKTGQRILENFLGL